MALTPQQRVLLSDRQGHALGSIVIDRIRQDLVFGRFDPGPDYARVRQLFAEYVEAANEQVLSVVGDLDAVIAALGLHLRAANGSGLPAIYDVQIADGNITFRTRTPAPGNSPDGRTGQQDVTARSAE
jgi:hypothetical protein